MSNFKAYSEPDKFPIKLWNILHYSTTKAIQWTSYGSTISIEFNSFQKEYLDSSIFKTRNIHSFIRQLNLYGFRNVKLKDRDPTTDLRNKSVHEYSHPLFNFINKDLAMTIKRVVQGKNNKLTSQNHESACSRPRPTSSKEGRTKAKKWFSSQKKISKEPCEDNEELFRKVRKIVNYNAKMEARQANFDLQLASSTLPTWT